MNEKFSVSNFLKELKASDFVLGCEMPMGYVPGLPTLLIKNDVLCIQIPYLKYQTTGVVDKTLVFPVRYVIELTLPDLKFVYYNDLSLNADFKDLDFNKPVGLFRHEAIKNLNKKAYKDKKNELFNAYDKLIDFLLNGSEYSDSDDMNIRNLFSLLLEPSLYKIYNLLNKDFCDKYLIKGVKK